MKVKLLKRARQMFVVEKKWSKASGTEYRVVQGSGRVCVPMCLWNNNIKEVLRYRRKDILTWVRSNYIRK